MKGKHMEDKKRKKQNLLEWVMESILLVLLLFLVFMMIYLVNILQGNARVVNYAGIVRGATQRLVKLEISGKPNDDLIIYLDTILDELQNGGDIYGLTPLKDNTYQTSLANLSKEWVGVKEEIYETRRLGESSPDILDISEKYFMMADKTVALAESYSDGTASRLRTIEIILILVIVVLLLLLLSKSISTVRLSKQNRELEKKSMIDSNTGLPNKGCCEEKIAEYGILNPDITYGCVMFDLNNLKIVNDRLGHKAGDALINSFAKILQLCSEDRLFVGRYGGDEFIALTSGLSEEEILDFLHKVEVKVDEYNKNGNTFKIEYACGYEISSHNTGNTMQTLLVRADEKMYQDKNAKKKKMLV